MCTPRRRPLPRPGRGLAALPSRAPCSARARALPVPAFPLCHQARTFSDPQAPTPCRAPPARDHTSGAARPAGGPSQSARRRPAAPVALGPSSLTARLAKAAAARLARPAAAAAAAPRLRPRLLYARRAPSHPAPQTPLCQQPPFGCGRRSLNPPLAPATPHPHPPPAPAPRPSPWGARRARPRARAAQPRRRAPTALRPTLQPEPARAQEATACAAARTRPGRHRARPASRSRDAARPPPGAPLSCPLCRARPQPPYLRHWNNTRAAGRRVTHPIYKPITPPGPSAPSPVP
jgi:hypothetical protein